MAWNELMPSLMFMTLGAVLLLAIVQFVLFLRKRRNRAIAARALGGGEERTYPPSPETARHPER